MQADLRQSVKVLICKLQQETWSSLSNSTNNKTILEFHQKTVSQKRTDRIKMACHTLNKFGFEFNIRSSYVPHSFLTEDFGTILRKHKLQSPQHLG